MDNRGSNNIMILCSAMQSQNRFEKKKKKNPGPKGSLNAHVERCFTYHNSAPACWLAILNINSSTSSKHRVRLIQQTHLAVRYLSPPTLLEDILIWQPSSTHRLALNKFLLPGDRFRWHRHLLPNQTDSPSFPLSTLLD
jgi:hypothetical protein